MHTFLYSELQDLTEDLSSLGGGDKSLRTSRMASAPPEYSGSRRSHLVTEIPDKATVGGTTGLKAVSYDDPEHRRCTEKKSNVNA